MLADHVDVVIGIDTHKHTHTAAVVTAVTGAALEAVGNSADRCEGLPTARRARTSSQGRGACGRSQGPARTARA